MNGVEILAVEQIAIAFKYNWAACWIAFAIFCFMAAVYGAIRSLDLGDWSYLVGSLMVGIIIGGLLAGMIGDMACIPTKYTNQYKVTISDEVSMNEFNEKYEIIDQEGKIYIVRERENES